MHYKITIYTRSGRPKVYRFATLDSAMRAASDLFSRTGIVAGIEAID